MLFTEKVVLIAKTIPSIMFHDYCRLYRQTSEELQHQILGIVYKFYVY